MLLPLVLAPVDEVCPGMNIDEVVDEKTLKLLEPRSGYVEQKARHKGKNSARYYFSNVNDSLSTIKAYNFLCIESLRANTA